jgi:hypothetical protein
VPALNVERKTFSASEIGAPRDWALPLVMRQAERMQAARNVARDQHGQALREVEEVRAAAGAARIDMGMPDAEIRALADRRAELMTNRIDAIAGPTDVRGLLAWLNEQMPALDARLFAFRGRAPEGDQLAGALARVRCRLWWRRQLRRAVVRARESHGVRTGEVGAMGGRQPYVTNDSNHRMQGRRVSNAAMLEATVIENAEGYCTSLAKAAAASTANPALRRGELMTRIVGCEAIADTEGHPGVFLTLTAPSRFHAKGGNNKRYRGATPSESHGWLCTTWGRVRAKLGNAGIKFYGFRVAEPHRDGCAHWHAMFWCDPASMDALLATVRAWWVRECDPAPMRVVHGVGCVRGRSSDLCLFSDPGRDKYRVNAKMMDKGGAAGYCAKYISKNIDDKGIDGHIDHDGETPEPKAVHGGTAKRVLTWAQAWSVRQFQPIGQPPVTVWRELRRVPVADQAGATARLGTAFEAANRKGTRKASWALYVLAQGGMMKGRAYLVRVATETLVRTGRYETTDQPRPVGLYDVARPDVWHLSARQEWKPRGAWSRVNSCPEAPAGTAGVVERATAVHPWTRVNNCTRQVPGAMVATEDEDGQPVEIFVPEHEIPEPRRTLATVVAGRVLWRNSGLKTWAQLIEPGGSASILKESPCPPVPSSKSPPPSRWALLRSLT